jgi:hypothetical protein
MRDSSPISQKRWGLYFGGVMANKNRVILIGIGFILFCYVEGWGADWKEYASNRSIAYYYDAGSITYPSKGVIKVWSKKVYSEKGVNEVVGDLGQKYMTLSHDQALYEFHCAEKKMRNLKALYYSTGGGLLGSEDHPEPKWVIINPESAGEVLYKILCK